MFTPSATLQTMLADAKASIKTQTAFVDEQNNALIGVTEEIANINRLGSKYAGQLAGALSGLETAKATYTAQLATGKRALAAANVDRKSAANAIQDAKNAWLATKNRVAQAAQAGRLDQYQNPTSVKPMPAVAPTGSLQGSSLYLNGASFTTPISISIDDMSDTLTKQQLELQQTARLRDEAYACKSRDQITEFLVWQARNQPPSAAQARETTMRNEDEKTYHVIAAFDDASIATVIAEPTRVARSAAPLITQVAPVETVNDANFDMMKEIRNMASQLASAQEQLRTLTCSNNALYDEVADLHKTVSCMKVNHRALYNEVTVLHKTVSAFKPYYPAAQRNAYKKQRAAQQAHNAAQQAHNAAYQARLNPDVLNGGSDQPALRSQELALNSPAVQVNVQEVQEDQEDQEDQEYA